MFRLQELALKEKKKRDLEISVLRSVATLLPEDVFVFEEYLAWEV